MNQNDTKPFLRTLIVTLAGINFSMVILNLLIPVKPLDGGMIAGEIADAWAGRENPAEWERDAWAGRENPAEWEQDPDWWKKRR